MICLGVPAAEQDGLNDYTPMSKPKSSFVCQNCGHVVGKWMGRCPDCGEWNSIIEDFYSGSVREGHSASLSEVSRPVRFLEVSAQEHQRFSTGILEFDRVLGGGVVPGSLILI